MGIGFIFAGARSPFYRFPCRGKWQFALLSAMPELGRMPFAPTGCGNQWGLGSFLLVRDRDFTHSHVGANGNLPSYTQRKRDRLFLNP